MVNLVEERLKKCLNRLATNLHPLELYVNIGNTPNKTLFLRRLREDQGRCAVYTKGRISANHCNQCSIVPTSLREATQFLILLPDVKVD